MRKLKEEEIRRFDEQGFVICRGVLGEDELRTCREESGRLIREIEAGGPADKNCGRGPEGIPYYLHYLHGNPNDFSLRLLAHPFVGDALNRLVGADFIPFWESLVFKLPGGGSSVPWHRDDFAQVEHGRHRAFNIDFYIDKSFPDNSCVWVVPGSHLWDNEKAKEWIAKGAKDFELPGRIPAEMEPGDALLHSTRVLHGSTVNKHPSLRRVVYFDSRSLRWNQENKAFHADVARERCRLFQYALHQRKTRPYKEDDEVFVYSPPAGMPVWKEGEAVDFRAERRPWPPA